MDLSGVDLGAPPPDVATYLPIGTALPGATLSGTLTLAAGCTYLVDDTGTAWLPIFARGVIRADGALTYDGQTFTDGAIVTLVGGGAERTVPDDDIPATCSTDGPVWIVEPPG